MSNDLTELTDTELDAVSGGKHGLIALNLGNIIVPVQVAEQSAAVVNMGVGTGGSNTIMQGITQTSTIGNTTTGPFTFSF